MKKIFLSLLGCSALLSASAYRMEWGSSVVISKPVYEDLYVFGGTVTINAPVYGDVIVAGGTININDSIMNDLLLAGGNVFLRGYIADDIRCAGGELHVYSNVGGDVMITGGSVEIAKDAVISGGLVSTGGTVVDNGTVNGNLKVTAGSFEFSGTANQNLDARADKLVINGTAAGQTVLAAADIAIGKNAAFGNKVRYWNRAGHVDFGGTVTNGEAVYDPALKMKTANWYFLGHSNVLGFLWYLMVVFSLIAVLQLLFGSMFRKAGHTTGQSLFKSLMFGFVFFIGVPVAAAVLLVSVVGIPIAIIMIAAYVLIVLLATVITSLVLANWYCDRLEYNWSYWKVVFSAMAIFVLLKLISFTPFLGWALLIVIACIALGALVRNVKWERRRPVAVQ